MFFAKSYYSVVHFTDIRTYRVFVISCRFEFSAVRVHAFLRRLCATCSHFTQFTRCTDRLLRSYDIQSINQSIINVVVLYLQQ